MQKYCCHCMQPVTATDTTCPFCGQPVDCEAPSHQLRPGTVLRERYYLGAALGQGGFGITYIGYDMQLRRKVAVKEYYPKGFVNRYNEASSLVKTDTDADSIDFFQKGKRRFLDEARLLSGFAGVDGVVDVWDCFEENNTVYIVMEHIDGITLKRHLAQNGKLSAEETFRLLTPVMNALMVIHRQNLIHRDISPDNIMLTQQGDFTKATLIDFGATRYASSVASKSLTVILKPGFAPIEQYGGWEDQGAWTDIYALCATIYQCVTGVIPQASLLRLQDDRVQRPSALGAKIGPYTEQVLLKGMSVNAADRYRDVETLLQEFAAASARDRSAAVQQNPSPVYPPQQNSDDVPTYPMFRQNGNPNKAQRSRQDAASPASDNGNRPNNAGGSQQRKTKKKRPALTIVGAAVLVFIAGIIVQYFTSPEFSSEKSKQTDSVTTPLESLLDQIEEENSNGSLFAFRFSHLIDYAGLVNETERQSLVEQMDEVTDRLQFDLAIVTTYSLGDKTLDDYAYDVYQANNYGCGTDKDGALLLISMGTNDWYILTSGAGITALPDETIRQIGNKITPDLSAGNYATAFSTFISECDTYVSAYQKP